VGRPSKAQPFRSFVVDLLLASPRMKSLEIVRRARMVGYEGGKSALYAVIASLRPRRSRPLGHQDKVPGEMIRHGMGQVDVRFVDGQTRTVTFLASRLEYSRYAVVTLMPDQGVETLVRSLVRHYQLIGGTPMLATFDRGKPIATRADAEGQVLEWDLSFAYAAIQLGIGVQVRARRGADRGVGTNLGNWVKNGFFKDRSFAGEVDLEHQLGEWLARTNSVGSADDGNQLGNQAPAVLLTEERQRLRPLKVTPETLPLRVPVVVGPRAAVLYEDQAYAMPPDAVGLVGALYLYPDKVVVVAGRYQTSHPRYGTGARAAWDGASPSSRRQAPPPSGVPPEFADGAAIRREEANPTPSGA
jgi:transposase